MITQRKIRKYLGRYSSFFKPKFHKCIINGNENFEKSRIQDAIECYKRGLMNGEFSIPLERSQLEDAIDNLTYLIQKDLENPLYYNLRGLLFYKSGGQLYQFIAYDIAYNDWEKSEQLGSKEAAKYLCDYGPITVTY